jgi:hypothetical protein
MILPPYDVVYVAYCGSCFLLLMTEAYGDKCSCALTCVKEKQVKVKVEVE